MDDGIRSSPFGVLPLDLRFYLLQTVVGEWKRRLEVDQHESLTINIMYSIDISEYMFHELVTMD